MPQLLHDFRCFLRPRAIHSMKTGQGFSNALIKQLKYKCLELEGIFKISPGLIPLFQWFSTLMESMGEF